MKLSAVLLIGIAAFLSAAGAEISDRPMFWSHYVPWHIPANSSSTIYLHYNYPEFAPSGDSAADFREEFRQAEAAGIDGFAVDIVANPGHPTVFAEIVHEMLLAAEGTPFQVAVCLDVKTTVEQQAAELARILDWYGDHPNYPQYHGRPLVFTYTWFEWTPKEWREIRSRLRQAGHEIALVANFSTGYTPRTAEWLGSYLDCFDICYSFGEGGIDGVPPEESIDLMRSVAAEGGRKYMEGLGPGYYGAWLNGRNDFYQPHRGFDQLHDLFLLARPEENGWMHATTWNDHDESSLLPMVLTSANPVLLAAYGRSYKGLPPVSEEPQVFFAYHREELPGTLLRLEAMTAPSLASGSVTVSGRLLDHAGRAVAELEPHSLSNADFERAEWLVPTAALAYSPSLTPEIRVVSGEYDRSVRLPPVFLVNGWHQNTVTVKVPVGEMTDFPNEFELSVDADRVKAAIAFDAPAPVRSATLWRNDRPLAAFLPQTDGRTLLNLYCTASADYAVQVDGGEVIRAVRKFADAGSAEFQWDAAGVTSTGNLDWTPAAILLAVTPETRITLEVSGVEPVTLSAAEINGRQLIRHGGLSLEVPPADVTLQNHPAVGIASGRFDVEVLSREPHVNDSYYVRYVLEDGRVGLTAVEFPAIGSPLINAEVIATAVNLETSSGATGMPGANEYLTPRAALPLTTPGVEATAIHPASLRGGRWNFNGDGRDYLGDMPVKIPPEWLAPSDRDEGQVLRLDGERALKMRLRTWPIGNATVDFLIRPAAGNAERCGLVGRVGWGDAVSIFLLPDGRVEVVRDGNETVPAEILVSDRALMPDRWQRLRVTNDSREIAVYIDGEAAGRRTITPSRSYGNATWLIGGGFGDAAHFKGDIDDLTVLGAAFPPGAEGYPEWRDYPLHGPLPSDFEFTVDASENISQRQWRLSDPALGVADAAGTLTLRADGRLQHGQAELAGFELEEGQRIVLPYTGFTRGQPEHDWAALLVSLVNEAGHSYNFNIGNSDNLMISVNDPEWRILTGHSGYRFPCELSFVKFKGRVHLFAGAEKVFSFRDNPADPYRKVRISLTVVNAQDSAEAAFDTPWSNPVR